MNEHEPHHPPSRRRQLLFSVAAGVVGVIVVAAVALLVTTGAHERADLADAVATANETTAELQDELARVRAELAGEQRLSACRSLYLDDTRRAAALSQIALSDLFAAVVEREPPETDAERAEAVERNRQLVAELTAENEPLRASITALDEYTAIDPPPAECPHPDWED